MRSTFNFEYYIDLCLTLLPDNDPILKRIFPYTILHITYFIYHFHFYATPSALSTNTGKLQTIICHTLESIMLFRKAHIKALQYCNLWRPQTDMPHVVLNILNISGK